MSGSSGYATTPNFGLKKPSTGADDGLWGTHWNQNADTLDATLKLHGDAIAGLGTGGVTSWNTRVGAVVLTNADVTAVLPPSSTTPTMDGTAAIGVGTTWARSDHIHPTDTSRASVASVPVASGTAPIMDGTAAPGTATAWARGDHVHPTDTSRYAASNPSGYQTAAQLAAAVAGYLPLAGGGTVSGNVAATGSLSAGNRITSNDSMNISGNFYVANDFAYYFQRSSSDGYWRWVSNGNVNMTLIPGGALVLPYGVNPDTSGNFQIHGDGSYRYFVWSPGWLWTWNITNGQLVYSTPGGSNWFFNISDWSSGNFVAYVFGNGAYANASDERMKSDITPASHGLDAILSIEPITFRRWDRLKKAPRDRVELGFGARQIQAILPEAVVSMDAPPEWRAMLGDSEPILGVQSEAIVAALVNAIKTLNARIAVLEQRT